MRLPPPADGILAYTIEQAAYVTGLSKAAIYRAVKSGELPAKRTAKNSLGEPAGRILILRHQLEVWLENLPDDWWGLKY